MLRSCGDYDQYYASLAASEAPSTLPTPGLGEFGAVITFASNIPGETQTLPLAIYTALQVPGGEAAAARLSAISFALAVGGLLLSEWIGRRMRTWLGG